MINQKFYQKDRANAETLTAKILGSKGILAFDRLGGMTNRSYKTTLHDGRIVVVRFPGDGTDAIINRKDECLSTMLGCACGVDTTLHYFDDYGVKIMDYIPEAETMSAARLREPEILRKVAAIFRKLHASGVNTEVSFEVFAMARKYRRFIMDKGVALYSDFDDVTNEVERVKNLVDAQCNVRIVPCHCDSLCENWVLGANSRLYLIDWEYSGMNDAMWDLADVSIEAAYTDVEDDLLLKEYFCRDYTTEEFKNFTANKIYLDYLWTLWGKTRVPYDGEFMENYANERYARLKENLHVFNMIG